MYTRLFQIKIGNSDGKQQTQFHVNVKNIGTESWEDVDIAWEFAFIKKIEEKLSGTCAILCENIKELN